jgi:hypothetical protein
VDPAILDDDADVARVGQDVHIEVGAPTTTIMSASQPFLIWPSSSPRPNAWVTRRVAFAGVQAPSTLDTFLRSFTHGQGL